MLPEKIPQLSPEARDLGFTDPWCLLGGRWGLKLELAYKLGRMAYYLATGNEVAIILTIISGFRTAAEQDALRKAGKNTADNDKSTHLACPATGADVWVNVTVSDAVKILVGEAAARAGLRWGGGGALAKNGIPLDWNHVDLGPRRG